MRILVTACNGNIGRGIVPKLRALGHELVLTDLNQPADNLDLPFHQVDIQNGFGLEKAAIGCDAIIHLPAWHGIHWQQKTEVDFWKLNVDGLFWSLQAAKSAGISRFIFLSSQAWHGHYDKYGFTKRIGEELCEFQRRANGLRYVAVRPNDLTPWGSDWVNRYGARLLYGGVDRDDVLNAVVLSIQRLSAALNGEPEAIILDALRPNAFTEEQLDGWEKDPIGTCERIFPGSASLIEKYAIKISHRPHVVTSFLGWEEVGYAPRHHFGTFLEELRTADETEGIHSVLARHCAY
jgi:NAD dependent epimerase/dehydratase family